SPAVSSSRHFRKTPFTPGSRGSPYVRANRAGPPSSDGVPFSWKVALVSPTSAGSLERGARDAAPWSPLTGRLQDTASPQGPSRAGMNPDQSPQAEVPPTLEAPRAPPTRIESRGGAPPTRRDVPSTRTDVHERLRSILSSPGQRLHDFELL